MLRLPIPEMTQERRKELSKLAGQYAEKARVAVRNVRRDGMDNLKADENKKEISEDERKRHETEVQKLTDATIADIDAAASAKEKEILGDRKSVVEGKSVSVRVDLGGRRIIKTKKKTITKKTEVKERNQ